LPLTSRFRWGWIAAARTVTTLHVGPLAIGALHRVLHEQLGVSLPRPILLRIHEVSNGNPFFALEIARAIGGRDLPPLVSEPLPIPATLRELVHERIAELPAATRSALVAASAVSQPTPELIEAAGGSRANLQPAIDEGVIRLADDRIQFAHPLLAAAAYADADASQLRDVHSRLAELVDDLEERARHLALSTDGPDDAVAAVVEEAARRSRARGASATAAELAEQAFRLTAGHQPREATTRRAVAAADWALEAGDSAKARRLLEELVALLPPGPERADALSRLGWVILTRRPPERTGPLHRQALEEATDTAVKVRAHRGLSWAAHVAGDLGTAEVHARSAVELAELDCDPTNLALSLADLAFVEALRGRGLSRETMQRALELEERLDTLPIVGRPTWVFGVLLAMTGELDEARGLLDRLRHRASERGEENATPYILNWLSRIECFAGRWQLALGHAEESHQSTLETGQDGQGAFTLSSLAMVRARLGDVDGARAGAHEALQRGRLLGLRSVDFEARATLGFIEVSLGRPEEADRWLGTLHEEVRQAGFGEPTVFRFHPDAIEALVSLGRLDRAAELLDYLAERGRTLDRPWATATARRCHALMLGDRGELDQALRALEAALDVHDRLQEPFERARTLLVLGTVERRAKRRRAARETLAAALGAFEELGAPLWAARARAELARIGGRPAASGDLTATERRVAELVAEGLSNKEVAAALFVTPKTVATELSRIYGKLGVHSRTQLAHRLAEGQTADKV
jgi:ATP/maltotriose-dependent transcriptional regulator MalT